VIRQALAIGVVLLLALAAATARARRDPPIESSRLSWVATAHQLGPVSYRDPAGAVSPDGRWIAYSEGRFLRVRPLTGGPSVEFPPGASQIRHLAWNPDSRRIVANGDTTPGSWALYDRASATRQPLWSDRRDTPSLTQLTWTPDGRELTGAAYGRDGAAVWTIPVDGGPGTSNAVPLRISYPAWTPKRELACIATVNGRERITLPCGGAALRAQPDADAFGPIAFSPDGATAYAALGNENGTVDLWAIPTASGTAQRLSAFSRDSYAPSVAADGSVVFKVQSYRTVVAVAPTAGGIATPLTTFHSETPSWDPTGKWLGVTYGTWRRIPDDAKYPDIAQDAGILSAEESQPVSAPARIVHDSASEDQSLCWSPNGEWIVFHSHKDQSDDLWIRRADGVPSARRITMLGRGAESGWPRWSADGRWLLFTAASRTARRTAIYVLGMDQAAGAVTAEARELDLAGFDASIFHAEWLDRGATIAAIAKEGPGRHVIVTLPRDGGTPHVVHRFESEHDIPGLGVSPDGQRVAFVAPAPGGFFQIFEMPVAGGTPRQVTTDPSNKTQPAWSPDGRRLAFTVWSYDAQFWRVSR
jgi:Tol biopolymer transport system component